MKLEDKIESETLLVNEIGLGGGGGGGGLFCLFLFLFVCLFLVEAQPSYVRVDTVDSPLQPVLATLVSSFQITRLLTRTFISNV